MARVTMTDLLNALDTEIDTIASVEEILILTKKLRAPHKIPAVFLVPETTPEKYKDGDHLFAHDFLISIIPITFYATSEEESLTHPSEGLIQLMDSIEELLENNLLDGKVVNVKCKSEAYEIPEEWFVADNIYVRGGIISYEGRTHPYRRDKTP